jgi:hypothetical protein
MRFLLLSIAALTLPSCFEGVVFKNPELYPYGIETLYFAVDLYESEHGPANDAEVWFVDSLPSCLEPGESCIGVSLGRWDRDVILLALIDGDQTAALLPHELLHANKGDTEHEQYDFVGLDARAFKEIRAIECERTRAGLVENPQRTDCDRR